jgi:hypothetical protein
MKTAVFIGSEDASHLRTDDDTRTWRLQRGGKGLNASCWLRRTRNVEGKIGIPGRYSIYPVGGEPGARVILIAPSELRKQHTWNAGQTRVKRELLAEAKGIT